MPDESILTRLDFIHYALICLIPDIKNVFPIEKLASVLLDAKRTLDTNQHKRKNGHEVEQETLTYAWFVKAMRLNSDSLKKKPFTDAMKTLETAGFISLNALLEMDAPGPLLDTTREILSSAKRISFHTGLEDDLLLLYTIVAFRRSLRSPEGMSLTAVKLSKLAEETESTCKAYLSRLERLDFLQAKKIGHKYFYRSTKRLNALYKQIEKEDKESLKVKSADKKSKLSIEEPISAEAPKIDSVMIELDEFPEYKPTPNFLCGPKVSTYLSEFRSKFYTAAWPPEDREGCIRLIYMVGGAEQAQSERQKCREYFEGIINGENLEMRSAVRWILDIGKQHHARAS